MIAWLNNSQRPALILTAAEAISRLVAFLIVVRLINYLGDAQFGELSYAFALANLVVVAADFGLSTYVVRHFSKTLAADRAQRQHFGQVLVLKLGLISVAIALIMAAGRLLTELTPLTVLGGACAIVFTNTRMFVEALYRVQQRMAYEAATKIGHALILALTLLYGITQQFSLEQFAVTYGIIAIIAASLSTALLWQLPLRPDWRNWQTHYWRTVMLAAWPFAASFGVNALFNYLDSVMLGLFGQIEALGWYNTAYKPIFFFTALAGMVINAFLPSIARLHQAGDHAALQRKVEELFGTIMTLAWPLLIGGTMVADKLFALLFRPEFAPGILAFQILLWSTGCIYVWAVFGNSLQVTGHEKTYLRNFAVAVIVTLVGNIIFIPWLSLYGAALATLLTQLTLVVLMYRDWQKYCHLAVWRNLWPPLLSGLLMGIVVWWLRSFDIWSIIGIGGIVYGTSLFLIQRLMKHPAV